MSGQPGFSDLSLLSCSHYPARLTCPSPPAMIALSIHHVMDILFLSVLSTLTCPTSCHGCPAMVVLSRFSCPGWLDPVGLSRLSGPSHPVLNVPFLLLCSGRSVLSVLSRLTAPGRPVKTVLSEPLCRSFLSWHPGQSSHDRTARQNSQNVTATTGQGVQ
jgi:hypothetical protein